MRNIDYIFIDSNNQNRDDKPCRNALPLLGYHFVVNPPSSEGLVLPGSDIRCAIHRIPGPIYDPDKYNRNSIFIRYCGSLKLETCNLKQRAALLRLLSELRKHFPEAKILGLSELAPKEPFHRNINVSDAMNQLRRELSDFP